mmetsp:Transcript_136634/g.380819  ORF Transcript_136634/g.380819 Transcript_136634/m.380819 type:complete len:193 (-) Transcript_136634:53-631(-)
MAYSTSSAASSEGVDWSVPDPAAVNAKRSRLVQLFEARRAATEQALGPRMACPPPLAKLPAQRPRTPPGTETDEWRGAAAQLERPAILRLLNAMQGRLEREESSRRLAEARLQPRRRQAMGTGGDRALSLSSLPLHDQARAVAAARTTGLWPEGAAGFKKPQREMNPVRRRLPNRPLSASPAPMATCPVVMG